MEATQCIADDALLDFAAGSMPAEAREALAEHIDSCASCRTLVAALAPTPESVTTAEELEGTSAGGSVLRPGERFGRYEILSALGRGGMAIVYEANDPKLGRSVALKLLRPDATSSHLEARLEAESRALARLSHPNVVQVYDAGREGSVAFVAMERIDGSTLREWLKESRSAEEVLGCLQAAGKGLAAAHAAGLVHRDVKPGNILVDASGRVCIGDFGLARVGGAREPGAAPTTAGSAELTAHGTILGTPAYMAPEQLRGEQASAASDQFGFCVTLYEALTGTRPYQGATPEALLASMDEGAAALSLEQLPKRVRGALTRGLALDASDRFKTMDALLEALAPEPASKAKRLAAGSLAACALVAVATIGWSAFAPGRSSAAASCDARAELEGVWDDALRERGRLQASRGQSDEATRQWLRVSRAVDAYANRWVAASDNVCRKPEQSETERARALRCLRSSREQLRGVTAAITSDDADYTKAIPASVDSLPLLLECTDATYAAGVPRPSGDTLAREVDALRDRLAAAEGLRVAGDTKGAHEALEELAEAAKKTDFAPLVAEVAFALTRNAPNVSGDIEAMYEARRDAVKAAEAAGHARLVVKGWLSLADFAAGSVSDIPRAREYAGYGKASLDRLAGDPLLTAEWHLIMGELDDRDGDFAGAESHFVAAAEHFRERDPVAHIEALSGLGLVYANTGRYEESLKAHEEALAARREYYGEDSTAIARSHTALGNTLLRIGRLDESLAHYQEAERIARVAYGSGHYVTGICIHNRGGVLSRLGRSEEAIAAFRQVVPIMEATHGTDHVNVARTLQGLGVALLGTGDTEAAVESLQRAYAITSAGLGDDHFQTASSAMDLAMALREDGKLDEAFTVAKNATATLEARLGPESVDVANALVILGETARRAEALTEAIDALRKARAIYKSATPSPQARLATAERYLAFALWDWRPKAREEAMQIALEARARLDAESEERATLDTWIRERSSGP